MHLFSIIDLKAEGYKSFEWLYVFSGAALKIYRQNLPFGCSNDTDIDHKSKKRYLISYFARRKFYIGYIHKVKYKTNRF